MSRNRLSGSAVDHNGKVTERDKDTTGLAKLCAAAGGCGLARLDLSGCELGAAAAAVLAGALVPGGARLLALRELLLDKNKLTTGGDALSAALLAGPSTAEVFAICMSE